MEQEIFTEEIINKKELISELQVIDCIMTRQRLLVKALMEELCAEKDIDYDAFMRGLYREK